MLNIRLTPPADTDLEAIAEYTIDKFGLNKAFEYRESLLKAMELLADNPQLGISQGHVKADTRRLVHEQHSIYYKVQEVDIVILRILGPGQDPSRNII